MSKLAAIIREHIEKTGAMTIADYMQVALQHPDYGYYRHGDPLGQAGDFVTAPEISQMFGEMVGLWCADIWRQMGKPEEFILLEMGPGRGTLMQDALRATSRITGFHAAMRLHLLESSATLLAQQMEKIGAFNPAYIDHVSQIPPLPVIVIANEFFDALPVRQLEKTFTGWCERLVTIVNGAPSFALSPPDDAFKLLIPQNLREALPGTVYEFSPASLNLMRDVAKHIAANGGAALVTDYGYLEPDGKPTLQAVADHAYADVLENSGAADITALVDFGMLHKAAVMQGAAAHGPVTQGDFLLGLGMELRADQLKTHASAEQCTAIDAALRRLTDPAEMGALFKVLAVTSPNLTGLPGF